MTFDGILDQTIALLQRRGRVTYRTLKRQFDLGDDVLEDLTMETEEPPLHAAAHIAAVVDYPCAMDILVRRPSDLEASLARKGVFATEVLTTGVVLYEA